MTNCARCYAEIGEDRVVCADCEGEILPHEHGGYGFFPGGDPRCFTPDGEGTTDEERAAWEAACKARDADEARSPEPGSCSHHQVVEDGKVVGAAIVTRARFGLGCYSFPCSDPSCDESWPPDPPEPSDSAFVAESTWDAAVTEAFAGDDEDETDRSDEGMPW